MHKYILGIDPSGNYVNGKGVTGWALVSDGKIIDTGFIEARDYPDRCKYWLAHVTLIRSLNKKYPDLFIQIEDFKLYHHKALGQAYNDMETSRLLGILELALYQANIPYRFEMASTAKRVCTDEKLEYWKVIIVKGRYKYTPEYVRLNRHVLDAIRHAIYCDSLLNGGEKNDGTRDC